jgi:stearoyl-CoA desaturase (delta-9 desaturase)
MNLSDYNLKQNIGKEGSIVWEGVFALILIPIITFIAIVWYVIENGNFETSSYVCLFIFYVWTGLSITMGYHRLWSHKAYKCNPIVKYLLLIAGTATMQNSVIQWASDHRKHHKDVDDPINDPYAATKGFWYSHFTWMLRYSSDDVQEIRGVSDLLKDKALVFQHRYYGILAMLSAFGLPALFGWLVGGNIVQCILLGGLLRIVLVHHITFCINSMAHILGRRPYSTKNTARDSFFTAMITGGEGYHNYHHAFAGDYRNGIRFFDFDPSKWMIAGLNKIGFTSDLKKTPQHLIEVAKARIIHEEALSSTCKTTHSTLEEKYTNFVSAMRKMYGVKQEYTKAKKENIMSKSDLNNIKSQYKDLKVEFLKSKKVYQASTMA